MQSFLFVEITERSQGEISSLARAKNALEAELRTHRAEHHNELNLEQKQREAEVVTCRLHRSCHVGSLILGFLTVIERCVQVERLEASLARAQSQLHANPDSLKVDECVENERQA